MLRPAPDGHHPIDRSTLVAGGAMVLIGVFVMWQASGMRLGSPTRMGPGYYPMLLGVALVGLGGLICLIERRLALEPDQTLTENGRPVWRARIFVPLSMIVFALLLRPAGLAPACIGLVLIASLAGPNLSLARTIGLAVATPILAWAIFIRGLGLPLKLVEGLL